MERSTMSCSATIRLDDYRADAHFVGALVGRYANRIAKGHFAVGGREYDVAINDPPNHLHGGPNGFHRAVWGCDTFVHGTDVGALLTHVARPEDDGYPGSLNVRVGYTLTADNALVVDYAATTDAATPATFTQHAYFNLAGHDRGRCARPPADDQRVALYAGRRDAIPTGELRRVGGTPFDFTTPRAIGDRIDVDDEQLRIGGGYDHNFVLDRGDDSGSDASRRASTSRRCGRVMEIHTTEPGIQFYSGNGFDDRVVGKQWRVVRTPLRARARDAAFPRFAEPSDLPDDDSRAGAGVSIEDDLQLLDSAPGPPRMTPRSLPGRGRPTMPLTRRLLFTLLAALAASLGAGVARAQTLPYQNQSLSFDERVNDLVGRMTLEEKVLQMKDVAPAIPRLGVPEYNWWNEALHGVARSGLATVFPQAIGMAATWNDSLMFRLATVISDEARAKHQRVPAQRTATSGIRDSPSGRRTSTSSAIRGGDAARRPTAKIRFSPESSACSSFAGCRATIRSTSRPSRR